MGKRNFGSVMGLLLLAPTGAMANTVGIAPLPEPGTLLLMVSGVAALLGFRKLVK